MASERRTTCGVCVKITLCGICWAFSLDTELRAAYGFVFQESALSSKMGVAMRRVSSPSTSTVGQNCFELHLLDDGPSHSD